MGGDRQLCKTLGASQGFLIYIIWDEVAGAQLGVYRLMH